MHFSGDTSSRKSTPVKQKSSRKHPLTPSAKEREPLPKRVAIMDEESVSQPITSTTTSYLGYENPSGFQIKKRRCSLKSLINEHFEVNVGDEHFITQEEVLKILQLSSAKRLTQANFERFS